MSIQLVLLVQFVLDLDANRRENAIHTQLSHSYIETLKKCKTLKVPFLPKYAFLNIVFYFL